MPQLIASAVHLAGSVVVDLNSANADAGDVFVLVQANQLDGEWLGIRIVVATSECPSVTGDITYNATSAWLTVIPYTCEESHANVAIWTLVSLMN